MDQNLGYYIWVYIVSFVGYPILAHFFDKCCCFNQSIRQFGKRGELQILKELKEKNAENGCTFYDPEMNSPMNSPNHNDVPVQKTNNKDNYNGDYLSALCTSRVYYNTINYDKYPNPTIEQIMMSDSLFVFLNTNELISTFTTLPGHSYSRYERRMAFVTQHGLALLLAVLATSAFSNDSYSAILFNICFVTPLTLLVNTSFYYITACPCTKGEWNCCLRCIFSILEYFGSCFAHFYSLLSIIFLIIAGALSYGSDDNDLKCLIKYVTQVFVLSTGMSLLLHVLKIHVFIHVAFKFCGFVLFDDIGKWLREYVEFNKLEKEKYYSVWKMGCIFTIEIWYPIHKKASSVTPELTLDPVVVGTTVEISPQNHNYHMITNSSDYNNISHAQILNQYHDEKRNDQNHKLEDHHIHSQENENEHNKERHHHEHYKEQHHHEHYKEQHHHEHDKEHHHHEHDKDQHHHEHDKDQHHHEHDKDQHHHEHDKDQHHHELDGSGIGSVDQSYDNLRTMILSSNNIQ